MIRQQTINPTDLYKCLNEWGVSRLANGQTFLRVTINMIFWRNRIVYILKENWRKRSIFYIGNQVKIFSILLVSKLHVNWNTKLVNENRYAWNFKTKSIHVLAGALNLMRKEFQELSNKITAVSSLVETQP